MRQHAGSHALEHYTAYALEKSQTGDNRTRWKCSHRKDGFKSFEIKVDQACTLRLQAHSGNYKLRDNIDVEEDSGLPRESAADDNAKRYADTPITPSGITTKGGEETPRTKLQSDQTGEADGYGEFEDKEDMTANTENEKKQKVAVTESTMDEHIKILHAHLKDTHILYSVVFSVVSAAVYYCFAVNASRRV